MATRILWTGSASSPCFAALLELTQDVPPQRIRQEHVQGDRGRLILLREVDCVRAARCNQDFEPLVTRETGKDTGVVRVICKKNPRHKQRQG